MTRLMWPGLLVVLLGSLVALHAATLVVSLAGAGPRAICAAGDDPAHPRTGWLVEIDAEPMKDGQLRVVLRLGDAGAQPIVDAGVTVRVAGAEVALAHRGDGRYEAMLAGIEPGAWPCRVRVSREGRAWTFDRMVRPRSPAEFDE